MKLPEYITKEEVRRVCNELGLKDWNTIKSPEISPQEAQRILDEVNTSGMNIPLEAFRQGLEVELEHGTRYPDANVTNNHPILTGKIVLAHLKESMDYYQRLDVAEIEGDMLKAAQNQDEAKLLEKYKKLIQARLLLSKMEEKEVGNP